MGREVRMVPASWEHPRNEKGNFIPLMKGSYAERAAEWDFAREQWQKGLQEVCGGSVFRLRTEAVSFRSRRPGSPPLPPSSGCDTGSRPLRARLRRVLCPSTARGFRDLCLVPPQPNHPSLVLGGGKDQKDRSLASARFGSLRFSPSAAARVLCAGRAIPALRSTVHTSERGQAEPARNLGNALALMVKRDDLRRAFHLSPSLLWGVVRGSADDNRIGVRKVNPAIAWPRRSRRGRAGARREVGR